MIRNLKKLNGNKMKYREEIEEIKEIKEIILLYFNKNIKNYQFN